MNPQPFPAYLQQLSAALKAGNATEHTHRPALKTLNEDIAWAVDEAAELLARSDIAAILQGFRATHPAGRPGGAFLPNLPGGV